MKISGFIITEPSKSDKGGGRMLLTNYHTHCRYCDGSGGPENYVKTAIEKGFAAIGFSSHAPLPVENTFTMKHKDLASYCAEIQRLREKYAGRIEVYLGLEIDYIDGEYGPSNELFKDLGLDYSIASIHMIRDRQKEDYYHPLDYTHDLFLRMLKERFHSDICLLVGTYFGMVGRMAETEPFNIIGHIDLVKKLNKKNIFFNENEHWYRDSAVSILPAIKNSGKIVEINTGGIARKATTEVYPSDWYLKRHFECDIPVMVNTDAHRPDLLDAAYAYGVEAAKAAGYKSLQVLLGGRWRSVPV